MAASNLVQAAEAPLLPLYEYRSTYFLVGRPNTKIQLSFKLKVIRTTDLYLGYTQLMMWDLLKISSPFRDLNYNPEVFYRMNFNTSTAHWLDLGLYEHESNGRDGEASRSWDRAYLRYHTRTDLGENWKIFWSIKAWVPYHYDATNHDFAHYRGVLEFQASLANVLGSVFEADDLTLRIYPGGRLYLNPLLGGQELTLRGKVRAQNFLPFVVAQVFHGYGENMLNYKESRYGLRAGVGF